MLHHVSLGTNDVIKARAFYTPVLETLGMKIMDENETVVIYGSSIKVFSVGLPEDRKPSTVGNGTHVAFGAETRAMVDECYKRALANGGKDNGEPGLRAKYDRNYYAAFVLDPDGNRLEILTFNAV